MVAHSSPIDPETPGDPKFHVSELRILVIGYSLGRIRQQAGGFGNLIQMHTLINEGLKHMYGIDFKVTFDEVVEVFRMLQDSGLAKFREPKDWKRSKSKEQEKKNDGSASKGIPR